jgi:hypothetical protein
VFDHVEARWVEQDGARVLECCNPTAFDATVRIFVEPAAAARSILGQAAALSWPTVSIPAGATRFLAPHKWIASR